MFFRLLSVTRTFFRELLELWLLPASAAFLPWPLCFRFFRLLSHCSFLYRTPVSQGCAEIIRLGLLDPDKAPQWMRQRRLALLVDHADFWLERFRSDRWMEKYVHLCGTWPQTGRPALLCSFHWGAGMWALRSMRRHGLHVHIITASTERRFFSGHPLLHAYAVVRTNSIARVLGRPVIETSSSLRPVLQALTDYEQVAAIVDVPSDSVQSCVDVTLLGHPVQMPRGIFRVAVNHRVPVVVQLYGINLENGHREISIFHAGIHSDVRELMSTVYSHLDTALRQDSASWHLWGEARRFFRT